MRVDGSQMCNRRSLENFNCSVSLLKSCFGPNGMHCLLEGSDGRASFVQTGVQAFNFQNEPLMRFVDEALKRHLCYSGDGSKKVAIIVESLLRECSRLRLEKSASRNSISHVLQYFKSTLVMSIIPLLLDRHKKIFRSLSLTDSCKSLELHMEAILCTSFGSRCSYKIRKKLKELIVEMLLPPTTTSSQAAMDSQATTVIQAATDISGLRELTLQYQRWPGVYIVSAEGVSVSHSQVLTGFLLDRAVGVPHLMDSLSTATRFKVLLMTSDLCPPMTDTTLCISSKSHLKQTMNPFSSHSGQVVEWMAVNNVRLVVCSIKFSQQSARLLNEHNIATVEMVDKETLLAIAEYCGRQTLVHANYLADLSNSVTIDCTGVKYVTIGKRRLLHLELSRDRGREGSHIDRAHSLVLCGPTLSYCRQLAEMILNSLKLIQRWTEPVFLNGWSSLVSVCSGGSWEFALAHELDEYITSNAIHKDTAEWLAIKALKKGLLEIPHTLILNASSRKDATRSLLLCDGCVPRLVMVSPTSGSLVEVKESALWRAGEPLATQLEVLNSALTIICQLLRVDNVIRAKRGTQFSRSLKVVEGEQADSESED